MSDANLVKDFTEASLGIKCPNTPSVMSEEEVRFLIKNILSEMMEMAVTISNNPKAFLTECLDIADLPKNSSGNSEVDIIVEQADAFVDAYYYGLNAFAKKGVNISKVFHLVHQANMAKKFPDGTFHRREDGKVIKPPDWKEPDVASQIKEQMSKGAWQ